LIDPIHKGVSGFEESVFSLGITHSKVSNRAAKKFTVSNPGVTLAWRQYIWGAWFGGVRLHTSEWEARKSLQSNVAEDVTFVQLESEVRFSPQFSLNSQSVWLNSIFARCVRPHFGFGLGALFFLKNKGFPIERSKIERTEPGVSFVFGNRIILNNYLAIGASWETFRGVKTYDYTGSRWVAEIIIGDVILPTLQGGAP
jgi:hypothetical protein